MRRNLVAGAVLTLLLGAATAQAQHYAGCYYPGIPQNPDACGPGFYWTSPCGLTYGPAYCLRPPYPPFQGMVPGPPPQRAPGAPPVRMPNGLCYPGGYAPGNPESCPPMFPTHPYARSPRDFFMYYDKDEPSYVR
jgi:hypothetical protein